MYAYDIQYMNIKVDLLFLLTKFGLIKLICGNFYSSVGNGIQYFVGLNNVFSSKGADRLVMYSRIWYTYCDRVWFIGIRSNKIKGSDSVVFLVQHCGPPFTIFLCPFPLSYTTFFDNSAHT